MVRKNKKIATGQEDYYAACCLPNYGYFKELYNMTAIDLSKQQALEADPKVIQEISFTENLDRDEDTQMLLIIEEAQVTALDFSLGTVRLL